MKMTDGLFHKIFDEIAAEYPEIENEHWIVDIGAAKLADTPEAFDVIVMPNLYGDILSDVAAQITGSVGLAGSANIGDGFAMFEAIHGSAPRRAGQNLANPSGLLLGAVQMLVHIGQPEIAAKVHNAWLRTLEDGVHTYDIFRDGVSKEKVGTKEFADAVIARLGLDPQSLNKVEYLSTPSIGTQSRAKERKPADKKLIGVDIFLHHHDRDPNKLGDAIKNIRAGNMELTMITNRGVKVYPGGYPETFCTDHWRCRFKSEDLKPSSYAEVINLLQQVSNAGFDIIKTENLVTMDGVAMFSAGQGQ
jgi:isocitrate dehydrogenase